MSVLALLREKWLPPPEFTGSFKGKTVLVTGANSGIGLEVAKKAAAHNAERLIITTRSNTKGESTKEQIQQYLSTSGKGSGTEIVPLTLDLTTLDGVESFVQMFKQKTDRLDFAILNAGVILAKHNLTLDGYEEALQVNTISSVFLATLLLPMMVSTSDATDTQTHLTFVSSRAAESAVLPPAQVQYSETPLKDLSQESRFPPGPIGSQVQYGLSKLLVEYAIQRLHQLPYITNHDTGKPKVLINSACPGACWTNIARNYDHLSVMGVFWALFIPLFAKNPALGADSALAAVTAGEQGRGRMWAVTFYVEELEVMKSVEGRAFGEKVWAELEKVMIGKQASVKGILEGTQA